ncbi:probable leucine-rich repeat receptor-like protein kinase At5g63930 [Papaver somniferum]|uniref:probable leucine-rich repeat receptor-like protein kinase At5g63930 n=1 Tax=Papaver somniferum TaxID=3469 RepID=UPI000E7051C2|nr:probable leucine-rich repeat receptor-like protein kinase At5g63930 [Papaver somniferum]
MTPAEMFSYPAPNTTLTGTVSPSLFNLTHLEYLDLSFNELDYSKVQYQLSKLKNLTHLDVASSNFSGSISTQFANVSSLRYLDISGYVQTSDPRNFGYTASEFPLISSSINWVKELVHLRVLRLSGVDLSKATVQKNWAKPISFLADLRELHLSACGISSPIFPVHEFLNLSRLSTLKMNNNNDFHSSIPIQIANLTSLSVLELAGCFSLEGSIPYLPQLQRLDVRASVNLLVNLTSMFERQWPKLQVLWMTSTYVNSSVPSSILNAPLLVSLIAPGCSIKGSLPTFIVNLSKLEYLDLSDNDLTGYLPSLGSNMKNLRYLSLSNNKLQGPIPESICEISSLQQLYLSSNGLSSTIPSCITKLRNLKYLDVSSNSLEGIFSLNSLINELSVTELNFNFNNIIIEIDEHFYPTNFQLKNLQLQSCNMKGFTNLNRLDLSNNNLMGSIPSCLFKHQTLDCLDLSQNNLQGTLPKVFHFNEDKFIHSNLAQNKLQGSLPLPSKKTIHFDLSQNHFSGSISFEVGERLSKSRYASLSSNQLSGTIPLSFCTNNGFEMSSCTIQSLNLSNNTLNGRIPSSLGNCSSLFSLHLGMNNLIGNAPNELEQAPIQYLMLNENFLEGIFPEFIQRFEMLTVLTLGNNNYEGSVPTFVGSFKYLRILSLRSNRFNGSIPKEISHLGRLQILDLSMNNLSGSIPKRLGNLKMLTSRPNSSTADFGGGWLISDIQLRMRINGVLQYLKRLKEYSSGMDLSSLIWVNENRQRRRQRGLILTKMGHPLLTSVARKP